MVDKKPYIYYEIDNPEFQVVADLVNTNGGDALLQLYANNPSELLDYVGDGTLTNRERIISAYGFAQIQEALNDDGSVKLSDENLPIMIGTKLLVPKSKIGTLSDSLLLTLTTQEPNDGKKFTNFVSQTLKDLLENNDYKSIKKNDKFGSFVDFYPQITIWLWSRSLGELINISPFVYSCVTNNGGDAATFVIDLPPIIGKFSDGKWKIDTSTITNFLSRDFTAQSSLFKIIGKNFSENDFYFQKVVSQNDLVFIQYETLELEKDIRSKDSQKYTIDYSQIPNRIYDLIGMVDSSNIQINPQSAEIGIRIKGRDLSKALIDDGSYFYMEEFLGTIFPDREKHPKLIDRVYGKIENFTTMGFRSVEEHIRFVINLFYATGYVPNDIFSGYGDRINVKSEGVVNDKRINIKKDIIQDNQKLLNENITNSRKIEGIQNPKSVAETKNRIITFLNFLKSQKKLSNNQFGLSGWQSYTYNGKTYKENEVPSELHGFLIKKPSSSVGGGITVINPNANAALSNAASIIYLNDNVVPKDIQDPTPLDGIWGIVDVEIDPSISNIRLYDTSIAEANGSILETIKCVCEEPFMEVFTDTYKDRFKVIVRRQPFDEKYYNELVEETAIPEIDIDPEDVLKYDLGFNDSEIYTWYYLKPTGLFFGEEALAAGFVPAVILNEYVDIWGSRPYQKVTNYVPFVSKKDEDSKVNTNLRQAIIDLQFMININAYLPFTRSGTITINGDRRIKKKTAIRLKQTGEIFHVDSVQNSYIKGEKTIDRVTILQVSRGMVEKYMKPKTIQGFKNTISYFNIVDTSYDEQEFRKIESNFKFKQAEGNQVTGVSGQSSSNNASYLITKDWKVKPDVFEFFLNKMQFS